MRHEIAERAFRFATSILNLRDDQGFREMVAREILRPLVRSATSVGANLEEATGAQTKPDFVAEVSIARKEAPEVQYWLRLAVSARVLTESTAAPLRVDAERMGQVISAIVRNARRSDRRNPEHGHEPLHAPRAETNSRRDPGMKHEA